MITKTVPSKERIEADRKRGARAMGDLLDEYRRQKRIGLEGNLYHKTQIELAYNSNHIEGSRLTEAQTRQIFETRTIDGPARIDDVWEASNHFRLFDLVLDTAEEPLSIDLVKRFHRTLKANTDQALSDSIYEPGAFKTLPNEVGGMLTVEPEKVAVCMDDLLSSYAETRKTFEAVIGLHHRFERIHPFQDGNGRVGRIIMFRECLANDIVPFVVRDDMKAYYYRGLSRYDEEPEWLLDTCRSFQDDFVARFLPLVPHVKPPRAG